MKVTCITIDEFFECLTAEKTIFQQTIRVSIINRPIDVQNKEPVKFAVSIQAAAVVETAEGEGQYLLQVGIPCGKDFKDDGGEYKGTEEAQRLKNRVCQYAADRGWRVLPGIIEE